MITDFFFDGPTGTDKIKINTGKGKLNASFTVSLANHILNQPGQGAMCGFECI
jgi:hypothetical protein